MGQLKKYLSILSICLFVCGVSYVLAGRYTEINTFTDDRETSAINDNFQALTEIVLGDRGFNDVVPAGNFSVAIRLNHSQNTIDYGIHVTPSWYTQVWVTDKQVDGFIVNFSLSPDSDSSLDWVLIK